MGLSFKPLEKIAEGVVNQINPFDNGKTFSNPQGNPVTPSAPAPSVLQQATHNGLTNLAGNIVKPLIQFPEDFSNTFANIGTKLGGGTDQTIQENMGGNPITGDILKASGATGKNAQLAGDTAQIALAAASPGIDSAVEGGVKSALPETVSDIAAKYAPRIASGAVQGAAFNTASAAGNGGTLPQDLEAAGTGAAFGAVLPVVGGVAKAAIPLVNKAISSVSESLAAPIEADNAIDKAASDTPKTTVTLKQAGEDAAQTAPAAPTVPSTPVVQSSPAEVPLPSDIAAQSVPLAHTSMPDVNQAIDDVATQYSAPTVHTGTVDDVLEQTSGQERLGGRLSSKLGAVLKKNLTPEENQAVEDFLDGAPTSELTPKALEVANALRPLREQGFDVRSAIKPDIGKVVDYSPRVNDDTLSGSVDRGAKTVKNIGQKLNLSSGYSEARVNDKFVGSHSTLIGSPTAHGLTDMGNGKFVDPKTGNIFTRMHATKQELEDAGIGKYARRTSSVNRIYHTDTLGLKARAEAVNALREDPNGHGLFTQQQVEDGVAPKGVQEITGVKGLEGIYAAEKDVHNLQQRLGFNRSATPLPLRAYDAVTNVATQAIVLNPFFHGMNQLYQTGIAAGNLPGLKGIPGHGMLDVLHAFFTVNEDDMREVIARGAGGSDYGASMDNLMSRLTHGASKFNSKSMAAIELRLRAALYKVSIDKGMTPTDAARNINTFLGDTKHVNETVRRATLFAHYFRTMSKAIGKQVLHPIEQRGSISNAAALAAVTAAVSYGYQKLTGNPNASVRLPGELGLLKEGVESGEGLAHGQGLQAAGVLTNRINPVLKEGVQQTFNKDLYTGQPVAGDRVGHAVTTLLAPAEQATKVTEGKKSIAEIAATQLGLSTPHAKGYEAAPNISALNTKGAIKEKTGDPTGYQQQAQYFTDLSTAQKSAQQAGTKTAAAFANYLARSKDPVTGQTIQLSPAQSIQEASALATDPTLMGIVQKFEKSQPSHDPVWDLSASQLKTYEEYKAMYTGDADKSEILQSAQNGSDNWITDIENAENTYYNNLQRAPGGKPPEANAQTPTYPVFSPATTALLAEYDSADAADRTTLLQNNAEPLSTAFNDIANWTNAMRKAEGAPQLAGYPEASPAVQAIINTYDALPKDNGPDGGSPDRDAWIQNNPTEYAQMSNYLTQASVYGLIKNASEAQFAGSTPDQELLKDIKEVGTNDIATTTVPASGSSPMSTVYAINPSLAFTQNSAASSYSDSTTADEKASTEARDAKNATKDIKYINSKNYGKTASIKLKSPHAIHPYKIRQHNFGVKFKVAEAKPTTKGRISLKSTV